MNDGIYTFTGTKPLNGKQNLKYKTSFFRILSGGITCVCLAVSMISMAIVGAFLFKRGI